MLSNIDSVNKDEYTCILAQANHTTEFYSLATGQQLFKNLPPSTNISIRDFSEKVSDGEITMEAANVSISEEGTTLRVFYHHKWYTATKSKLQAFRSNWADKSTTFGATFAQAVRNELGAVDDERDDLDFLTAFYEAHLDKDKVYFFLIRCTAGERIVCDAPSQPKALHICTQKDGVNDFVERLNIGISTFSHTTNVPADLNEIESLLGRLDFKAHQGLIVEHQGHFYKILLPQYSIYASIRGSIASRRLCYLGLRSARFTVERQIFLELYTTQEKLDDLETALFECCLKLHQLYMAKYVHRHSHLVEGVFSKALRLIHQQYLVDRVPTTPSKINDILTQQPLIANALLNSMNYRNKL